MRHNKFDLHSGANALSPIHMSARERLDEIAEILALGLVRLRARKSSRLSPVSENSSLDFNAHRSGGAVEPCATENAWK